MRPDVLGLVSQSGTSIVKHSSTGKVQAEKTGGRGSTGTY